LSERPIAADLLARELLALAHTQVTRQNFNPE